MQGEYINDYRCESLACKRKRTVRKTLLVRDRASIKNFFFVHLKRFMQIAHGTRKNNTIVDLSQTLEISALSVCCMTISLRGLQA